ncbi:MAG: hypothetical protein P8Z38_12620 [Robiginitalea sp.]
MKRILTAVFLLACALPASGQQQSKEDLKVQIFTHEERDNLQLWFNQELKRMGLSEEKESQYNSILVYYIAKISRLDDKDQEPRYPDWTTRTKIYPKTNSRRS